MKIRTKLSKKVSKKYWSILGIAVLVLTALFIGRQYGRIYSRSLINLQSETTTNPANQQSSKSRTKQQSVGTNEKQTTQNELEPSLEVERSEKTIDNNNSSTKSADNQPMQSEITDNNKVAETEPMPFITPEEQAILNIINAERQKDNLTYEQRIHLNELEMSILGSKNAEGVIIDRIKGKYYYMPPGKWKIPDDSIEISKEEADNYINKGVGQIIIE